MKRIECERCGDSLVVPGPKEEATEAETPLDHIRRTGHSHKREPRLTGCANCGNAWYYTGTADRATCPNCRGKAEPGSIPDNVDAPVEQATEY